MKNTTEEANNCIELLGQSYDEYNEYNEHYTQYLSHVIVDMDKFNLSFNEICEILSTLEELSSLTINSAHEFPLNLLIDDSILQLTGLSELNVSLNCPNSTIILNNFDDENLKLDKLNLEADIILLETEKFNCQEIFISSNQQTKFNSKVSFNNLLTFEIYGKVESLPADLFLSETLQKVTLNKLTTCKLPIKASLLNLEEFYISDSAVNELPNKIFKSRGIRRLKIDNIPIQNLEHCFEEGVKYNLDYLVICNTNITILPKPILENNKNLRYLDLENNKLISFPSILVNNQSFSELNASNNSFTVLEEPFIENDVLENLNIRGNSFVKLDGSFSQLRKISFLDIRSSDLKDLTGIHQLKSLKSLNINFDEIEIGFNDLFKLRKLKWLKTYPIGSVVSSPLNDAQKLRLIHLLLNNSPIDTYTKYELLLMLCISNGRLNQEANQELHNRRVENTSIDPQSKFFLLGKFSENKTIIKEKINTLPFQVKTKFDEEVTHLVVGKTPKEVIKIPEQLINRCIMIDERQLTELKETASPSFLMEEDKDMIENLNNFLDSDDPNNLDLAIELMNTGGIPQVLFEKVFYIMHSKLAYKKLLPLLEKYTPDDYRKALSFKLRSNKIFTARKGCKEIINKFEFVLTEHQIATMLTYHYKKYNFGLDSILSIAPLCSDLRKEMYSSIGLFETDVIRWHDIRKLEHKNLPFPKDLPYFHKVRSFIFKPNNPKKFYLNNNDLELFLNLEELVLSKLSMFEFRLNDKSVKALSNLNKLDLSKNNLTNENFCYDVKHLKSLKVLDLRGNKITIIPEDVREALQGCEILL
ncbi:hypothetical protein [Flammeovirga sp. SJP92]|uniref:leucine-rich repeat domain-containing protein n=1 Tax=Flammeovirga sp. SJP92 TaxID=1775430 RepID=UPI00078710ED|nr:hypothetical protein [Flammeovirga sp. SJP92]KXX67206.1 hypothetical protein AVL50_27860 [Flammeovirga sp. SJP92]